jgi:hypothetical protein
VVALYSGRIRCYKNARARESRRSEEPDNQRRASAVMREAHSRSGQNASTPVRIATRMVSPRLPISRDLLPTARSGRISDR